MSQTLAFIRPPAPRTWRVVRQRWPVLAGLPGVVAVLFFLLSCGDSRPEEANGDSASSDSHSVADSVLSLDSTAQRLAGIELHTADASSETELTANGTITYDANRVSVVASRVEGRIVSVRADLGQRVGAGTVLAILESPEVGAMRGDLERARANTEIAKRNYDREKRLYAEQITPEKELLDAEASYRTAEADLNSAVARLNSIGASGGAGGRFGLATTVSGTVVERNASPGQTVGPSNNLFTVADLRHVWITVDVYEGDLTRVRHGANVTVVPNALPGETFPGRVTYAGGIVDSASRTFKVRVELANAASRLRPGMFAQVQIRTIGVVGSGPIVIPEIAVQELDRKQIVFVAGVEPGTFVARTVSLGPRAGDGKVVISSGLSAGELVVTKGAFQLKAHLTKTSVGEGD